MRYEWKGEIYQHNTLDATHSVHFRNSLPSLNSSPAANFVLAIQIPSFYLSSQPGKESSLTNQVIQQAESKLTHYRLGMAGGMGLVVKIYECPQAKICGCGQLFCPLTFQILALNLSCCLIDKDSSRLLNTNCCR